MVLSYEVVGSGPGLVLLHGTSSTARRSWGPLVDELAARHTLVLLDLPGSGTSPLPTGPLDLDRLADQVAEAAGDAGLSTFAVAGSSLGAAIAIRTAARHPERVTRLATVVGFARARLLLRLNLELWAGLFERSDPDLAKLLISLSFSDAYLAHLPQEQLGQLMAALTTDPAPGTTAQIELGLRLDVSADLGALDVPTLVVSATDDRFVAPVHSHELADAIPGARLVEVPGGHASRLVDPQPTLSALLDFLRS
ncbi:alpha/beta fold hydrolase [Asanoa iriomotensis]|uniref:Alpha/beta hydrolase n=1 Tax=Asanoa iriomotensis TaxID=234613 RepID=A0ABQ4C2Q7_9ACTN|nr:alpha/beta fold hydrolase [Asanoa iriomotensis]GIF57044.1 alpha/beta hydrolase [Asanoa iriomotensis]